MKYSARIAPEQHSRFVEIVETIETRDEPFADGTRAVAPPGDGWHISDFTHEKRTTWTRTRFIRARGRP